jgi:hypothetical protein
MVYVLGGDDAIDDDATKCLVLRKNKQTEGRFF